MKLRGILSCARTQPLFAAAVIALVAPIAISAGSANADVFSGDPIDGATGLPHPMMPGLPLVLDGDDDKWNTGDDTIDPGFTGDIDLAVRVGTIADATIPPPSGAPGGPPLSVMQAGGGSTASAAEVDRKSVV